jgi:hypothetical protein
MQKAAISALTFLATLQLAANAPAALVEHHLVVEPDFVHQSEVNSVSYTGSVLTVPVPELTLSPGDSVRVTVELVPGKHLRLVPPVENGFLDFGASLHLIRAPNAGSIPSYGNGSTDTVQFFNAASQLFLSETEPSNFLSLIADQKINAASAFTIRTINPGEPTDATFRKWSFEWHMPTTFSNFYGTFPNTTTTFNENEVIIDFYNYAFDYVLLPPEAVYVVPEPATLTLLAMSLTPVFCGRRLRRRVRFARPTTPLAIRPRAHGRGTF